MAKRFTDSEKWEKPFLRGIKAPYKLLWLYILDTCNHAGIWNVDIEVAQIRIGEKIILIDAIKYFQNRIVLLDGGEKWFIIDFIEFQYGELNPTNRAHNSVILILNKYNLLDNELKIKPLTSPLQCAMDKDMDKDMDMDKELIFSNVIVNANVIKKGGAGGKTEVECHVDEVLNHFVEVTGKKIDTKNEVHRKFIRGRINEKIPIEDLKKIIELKNFKWKEDSKMREYIRIETLFNPTKCNSYLMEVKDIENNPELLKKIVEHVKFGKTGKQQHSAMEAYKQQLYQNV